MVISRAAFGPNAARGYAFLNWISIVGFEAIGLALMVAAAKSVFGYFGVEIGLPGTITLLIGLALLQLLLPRLGYQALMLVKKYFTAIFFITFGAIAIYILPNADYSSLAGGGGRSVLFAGIMLMLASGGFSWVGTGSDYTRYLPKNTSSPRIWWAVEIGNCIPIIALQVLGAAVASVTPLAEDPISGIPSALPDVFFVPYVVIAILTLLSINASSMYSSGLNLQTLGLNVRRTRAVFFDLIVGGTIAFFAVLAPTFEDALGVFLSLFGLWVAPWAGVYLCDWIARRGKYEPESLFPTPTDKGMYWGRGGVRWPAVVSQVVGMIIGGLWAEVEGVFTGPLMQASGGVNLSIPIGFVMGFVIYLLFTRTVRKSENPLRRQHEARRATKRF